MRHRSRTTVTILLLVLFIGCKEQEKKEDKNIRIISIVSILKEQAAHIDTSLYSIMKITDIDSMRKDTTYIPREKFREAATEFLSLPDLSDKEYQGRYTESDQYDETIDRVLIVYTPVAPEKEKIQRQEILVKAGGGSEDKVTNIIVNTLISTKDSLVEKKMLWRMDESFQVTTIRQLLGKPETVSTYKVVWNESE
jgi:hypothetical protein